MRTLPRPMRFLLSVAALDLLALALVIAACWLGGWQQRADYLHGLVYAGMVLLAAAGLRFVTGTSEELSQGADGWAFLQPNLRGQHERMQRSRASAGVPLPLLLLVAGAIPFALGLLLQ